MEWEGSKAARYGQGTREGVEGLLVDFCVPIGIAAEIETRVPTGGLKNRADGAGPATRGGAGSGAQVGRQGGPVAGHRNKVVAGNCFFVAEFVPIVPTTAWK